MQGYGGRRRIIVGGRPVVSNTVSSASRWPLHTRKGRAAQDTRACTPRFGVQNISHNRPSLA